MESEQTPSFDIDRDKYALQSNRGDATLRSVKLPEIGVQCGNNYIPWVGKQVPRFVVTLPPPPPQLLITSTKRWFGEMACIAWCYARCDQFFI